MYFQAFSSSHWSGTLWMFFFPEIHPNPVWLTQLASSSSELDVRPSECPTSLLVFLPPQRVVALEPAPAPAPPPWARAQVPWPWALAQALQRPQALWRGREPAANPELLRCAKDLGQRVVYPIHPVHLAVHRWNLEVSKVTPASAIGADPMLYRNGLFFLEDSIQYAIYIYIYYYIYIILYYIYYIYIYLIYIYHYTSLYITIYHYISLYIIIYHYISLYITIYHYISLYIIIYHYISLYIIIYHMHFGRDEFALTFCGLNLWDWLKLPVVTHWGSMDQIPIFANVVCFNPDWITKT